MSLSKSSSKLTQDRDLAIAAYDRWLKLSSQGLRASSNSHPLSERQLVESSQSQSHSPPHSLSGHALVEHSQSLSPHFSPSPVAVHSRLLPLESYSPSTRIPGSIPPNNLNATVLSPQHPIPPSCSTSIDLLDLDDAPYAPRSLVHSLIGSSFAGAPSPNPLQFSIATPAAQSVDLLGLDDAPWCHLSFRRFLLGVAIDKHEDAALQDAVNGVYNTMWELGGSLGFVLSGMASQHDWRQEQQASTMI